MNPTLLENQIKHIEQHKSVFVENWGRDVREYFDEYIGEYPDIYERLCGDLGISPIHVCKCNPNCQCL